ncbi:putative V-type proton ATPase 116 kDa subunit a [Blattamonas nauphoetae]|uniref:V-type proton ATPase subunit a n=1 Tax=Blattamonas nauphoetae TaxID=2049346 RepID=A0ABQ9XSN4_9EUKA|nr:putative V-type proton ATPase 116 kDa subunit a [Blattamonas nauphoetae]
MNHAEILGSHHIFVMKNQKKDDAIHMLRPEPMDYVQFVFPEETAYTAIKQLGNIGMTHFLDLNPRVKVNKREFSQDIIRCSELRRILRFFKAQLDARDLVPNPAETEENYRFTDLEDKFHTIERTLKDLIQTQTQMDQHKCELIEMRHVLTLGESFLLSAMNDAKQGMEMIEKNPAAARAMGMEASQIHGLSFLAGIIAQSKIEVFHRMLFVALRGNFVFEYRPVSEPVIDPVTNLREEKLVFFVFFTGDHARNRIMRICTSYGASLYPYPTTHEEHTQTLADIDNRLDTLVTVQARSDEQMEKELDIIQRNIVQWNVFVSRETGIYHSLNMFVVDSHAHCLVGEGWVPTRRLGIVNEALENATRVTRSAVPAISHVLPTSRTPPSLVETNKFTLAQQKIVSSYGVPSYGEVNPGLATLFTFPFLFALMFGDFGHGIIFTIISVFMCIFHKPLENMARTSDIGRYFHLGRFFLVNMGVMATYVGLLYNEVFSLSVNFFKSGYTVDSVTGSVTRTHTYVFGVDPIWRQCDNYLIFTNSMKMKMSVIVGVLHMILGIIFSLFNFIHKRQWLDVWCTFLPKLLLLLSLFGYMDFMIIYKWMDPTGNKPMLISTMINMFLGAFQPIADDTRLYIGQEAVQGVLFIVTIVCVVWMMIPKAAIEIAQIQKKKKATKGFKKSLIRSDSLHPSTSELLEINPDDLHMSNVERSDSDPSSYTPTQRLQKTVVEMQPVSLNEEEEEEEEMGAGEVIVHALIETIEFVLGAISNTASYLRLWALSLAHGELGEVFYQYLMILIPKLIPVFGSIIGIAAWIGVTLALIVMMEGLSAFLHCLRLHWVEFQNKFYQAEGYVFSPLSFKIIDESARLFIQPE